MKLYILFLSTLLLITILLFPRQGAAVYKPKLLPQNKILSFVNPATGETIKYRTNSQGWKDIEHSFARDGRKRVLVIGDSVTYALVPIDQQYTQIAEKRTGIEVLAIAKRGWSLRQKLNAWKQYGRAYTPDLVICQFNVSDFWEGFIYPTVENVSAVTEILKEFKQAVSPVAFAVFCDPVNNKRLFNLDTTRTVKEICRQNQITFIPVRVDYPRFPDLHPNKEGNRQMGIDLARFLQ